MFRSLFSVIFALSFYSLLAAAAAPAAVGRNVVDEQALFTAIQAHHVDDVCAVVGRVDLAALDHAIELARHCQNPQRSKIMAALLHARLEALLRAHGIQPAGRR